MLLAFVRMRMPYDACNPDFELACCEMLFDSTRAYTGTEPLAPEDLWKARSHWIVLAMYHATTEREHALNVFASPRLWTGKFCRVQTGWTLGQFVLKLFAPRLCNESKNVAIVFYVRLWLPHAKVAIDSSTFVHLPIERGQAFQPALLVFFLFWLFVVCLFLCLLCFALRYFALLSLPFLSLAWLDFVCLFVCSSDWLWREDPPEWIFFDALSGFCSGNWGSMLFARLAHEIKQFEFPVQVTIAIRFRLILIVLALWDKPCLIVSEHTKQRTRDDWREDIDRRIKLAEHAAQEFITNNVSGLSAKPKLLTLSRFKQVSCHENAEG